jgi:intron-binding protein aquarius
MTVALSRARLGLYIFGRRDVFEACHELAPAFGQLLRRSDKLMLATGEMWPSQRILSEEQDDGGPMQGEVAMEGVEHLGTYVYQMTQTRMQQQQQPRGDEVLENRQWQAEPVPEQADED